MPKEKETPVQHARRAGVGDAAHGATASVTNDKAGTARTQSNSDDTESLRLVQKRSRFKVSRAADLLTVPLVREYIVKGLLDPNELSIWYGEPGAGKSFLLLHIAHCVSLGEPFFGRRVRAGPVLYVCLEGEVGFQRRIRAVRPSLGQPLYCIAESVDLFGANADRNLDELISAARSAGACLVIIDTLARVMVGGSENDAKDMGKLIKRVDALRRRTKAHVAIVHHAGKDASKGMRGHSSLLAATDVSVEVRRPSRKSKDRTWRLLKSKDDCDGVEFCFSLEVVQLGQDTDQEPITSCVVVPKEHATAASDESPLLPAEETALDTLTKGLDDKGEPPGPNVSVPGGVTRVLRIEDWRTLAYAANISSGETRARQKAFKQARESLASRGTIGIIGKYVFLQPTPETNA